MPDETMTDSRCVEDVVSVVRVFARAGEGLAARIGVTASDGSREMGEERTAVRCPTHTNCVAILTTLPGEELAGRVPAACDFAALAWLHAIDGHVIDVAHEPAVPGLSLGAYLQVPAEVRMWLARAGASMANLVDEARTLAERIAELGEWTAGAFDGLQRADPRQDPQVPAVVEDVPDRTESARDGIVWAPPLERSDVLVISAAPSPLVSAVEPAGSANAQPPDHRSSTPLDLPV